MTAKAYNARCITAWLATCLEDAAAKPDLYPDERYPAAAVAMFLARALYNVSYLNRRFVTPAYIVLGFMVHAGSCCFCSSS